MRIGPVDPSRANPPHFHPRHHGALGRLVDRIDPAPLRLVRAIDRFESCHPARVCCDPWWWACVPPAIRLQYWEYLERQNIAFADVSPGLLPREGAVPTHAPPAPKGWPLGPSAGPRPSYAMPHLGDVPPPTTPEVTRRITITLRREALDPSGNLIDVFA